ncbi:MAG: transthyretin-like family protein [Pirellulaceae bacterium]
MRNPINGRSEGLTAPVTRSWKRLDLRTCVCLACVFVVGCSGEPQEPVYSVRGQVLCDGKPLVDALVVLHRLDGQGRNLTARTDPAGRFEMTTYRQGDGAPVGLYAATVEYRELVQEGDEPTRSGRNLLPAMYAAPETSGLRCAVQAGANELPPWQLQRP